MPQLTMTEYQQAVHRYGSQAHGWLRHQGHSMLDVLHHWREAERQSLYTPGSLA